MQKTYAVGTPVGAIPADRGLKMQFSCPNHPEYSWRSKEPAVSSWFPANQKTQEALQSELDLCKCPTIEFVLDAEYTPRW